MNGYPSRFIHRYSDNRTPRRTEDDQRLPRTSLTLPYIGGLSEAVRRALRPLDIKVAFHPLRTLYTPPTGLPQRPCTKGPACRGGELAHPTPPTLNREKGTLPREYTALLD